MDRKHLAIAAIGFASLFGVAVPATAEPHSYVAVNVGQSQFSVYASEIESLFGCCSSTSFGHIDSQALDDTAVAWSVMFGHRFTPYFALEGGYTDFGEAAFSHSEGSNVHGILIGYVGKLDLGARMLSLAAVGTIPIGKFELNGKLGISRTESELSWSGTRQADCCAQPNPNGEIPISVHESRASLDFVIGVGASYALSNRFRLTVDWALIASAVNEDVAGASNIFNLRLGLQYRL